MPPEKAQRVYANVNGEFRLQSGSTPETAAYSLLNTLDVPLEETNQCLSVLSGQVGKSLEEVKQELSQWMVGLPQKAA